MSSVKTSRRTGLKQLMQIENLICQGIRSDAMSHRRGSLKSRFGITPVWRELRRVRNS